MTVIPFPSPGRPSGEVVELSEIRAGLNQAHARGAAQSEIQAALDRGGPAATHAFRLLNSPDANSRRYGSAALARMNRHQSGPSDEPPTAA